MAELHIILHIILYYNWCGATLFRAQEGPWRLGQRLTESPDFVDERRVVSAIIESYSSRLMCIAPSCLSFILLAFRKLIDAGTDVKLIVAS